MDSAKSFVLAHAEARRRAVNYVANVCPDGWRVTGRPPAKSRDQEEKYHALVGDIARQWTFMGQRWHPDDAKRLLVDAFSQAMRELGTPLHHDGRIVPSIDRLRIVQLGVQTSKFWVSEAANFIEFLQAFAAAEGITLSAQARPEPAADPQPKDPHAP